MNDDLISRQAAIDALTENKEMINAVLDSLTLHYDARRNQEQRRGQINEDIETIKGLPSAQPEQKWIPVTEGLPEEGKQVLVCDDFGDIYIAEYETFSDGEWRWCESVEYRSLYGIVAWMPLPEPYQKEGD